MKCDTLCTFTTLMYEKIPVEFELNGKTYRGHFKPVSGRGNTCWYLNVNDYYWGNMDYYPQRGFRFTYTSDKLKGLEQHEQYFIDVIIAWYG